ncbi:unnamed protein product [Prorocentrum cordatum]|uniref:Hexosyltransferase n=1 Tax=Prorocentrum cordatum TaxID=2364126 RepID=A0ABN9WFG0_9DINO|nr:unnamed protein product [Polarella glacialis]
MPGDGAARCGAEPDHEGDQLLTPGAQRALDAWHWRRRGSAPLAALLLVAAALAAYHSAQAQRTRGAEVAPAAAGATGLVEDRDPLEIVTAERLEKMSTKELIKLAKKLQGEVAEIDDDMDLSVEEDPCKTRRESARRLQAARLRRLQAEAESVEIGKEEFEELLEEEIAEIEGEEDPCSMPEEAFLKVEEVLDQEIVGTESESQGALREEEAKLKKVHGSVEAEASGHTATEVSAEGLNSTHRHRKPPASAKCSASHEDCRSTECCSDPGLQCYEKNKWWAMCLVACIPGAPDPADVDPEVWSCREIGERSGGRPIEPEECHDVHDNCMDSKCCKDPGFACFTKNDTFARCMPQCAPGPQYFDLDNGDPWSCHQVGAAALSTVGNWTKANCSGDADDCRESRCCATSGLQCYEVGGKSARCLASCPEGGGPCTELGYRTPPPPTELPSGPLGGKVGGWVKDSCSQDGADCSGTSCCVGRGMQCYEKDSAHATCADKCHANSTWSCKKLGTRSWGLALVGYPSLFCVTFLRIDSYEPALVEYQWKERTGIFACDSFRIFADNVTTIAGRETLKTPKMEVEVIKDGTAGNAGIFMKAWEMIFAEGSIWDHDWTVKADPDAVFLPDRLRWRLEPHTDNSHGSHGGLFVMNCNAWPDLAVYPMMYGSVEVFSRAAMRQYSKHSEKCRKSLPWQEWGEDFFMTRCMDHVGVGSVEDFGLVGDDVCVGPGQKGAGECDDSNRAAFHPFKDLESWKRCYKNAIK